MHQCSGCHRHHQLEALADDGFSLNENRPKKMITDNPEIAAHAKLKCDYCGQLSYAFCYAEKMSCINQLTIFACWYAFGVVVII